MPANHPGHKDSHVPTTGKRKLSVRTSISRGSWQPASRHKSFPNQDKTSRRTLKGGQSKVCCQRSDMWGAVARWKPKRFLARWKVQLTKHCTKWSSQTDYDNACGYFSILTGSFIFGNICDFVSLPTAISRSPHVLVAVSEMVVRGWSKFWQPCLSICMNISGYGLSLNFLLTRHLTDFLRNMWWHIMQCLSTETTLIVNNGDTVRAQVALQTGVRSSIVQRVSQSIPSKYPLSWWTQRAQRTGHECRMQCLNSWLGMLPISWSAAASSSSRFLNLLPFRDFFRRW